MWFSNCLWKIFWEAFNVSFVHAVSVASFSHSIISLCDEVGGFFLLSMNEELWMKCSLVNSGFGGLDTISLVWIVVHLHVYDVEDNSVSPLVWTLVSNFAVLICMACCGSYRVGSRVVGKCWWIYSIAPTVHWQYTRKKVICMVVLPLAVHYTSLLHYGSVLLLLICVFWFGCRVHNWVIYVIWTFFSECFK